MELDHTSLDSMITAMFLFYLLDRIKEIHEGISDTVKVRCLKSNYGANGCGEWSKHPLNFLASTPAASDLCEYCGNRLLSLGGNPHGHRLFLGQTIYFYR